MNLTVEIPDDLVGPLNVAGGDLSRRALEALDLEEYKSGHITKADPPGWVDVRKVASVHLHDASLAKLDAGEEDTIVLVIEIPADLPLMDDEDGVIAARGKGLDVIGTLGILSPTLFT